MKPEITTENVKSENYFFCFHGFPNKNCYIYICIWCSIKSIFLISRRQKLLFLWLKFHILGRLPWWWWEFDVFSLSHLSITYVSSLFNYLLYDILFLYKKEKKWLKLTHLLVETKPLHLPNDGCNLWWTRKFRSSDFCHLQIAHNLNMFIQDIFCW